MHIRILFLAALSSIGLFGFVPTGASVFDERLRLRPDVYLSLPEPQPVAYVVPAKLRHLDVLAIEQRARVAAADQLESTRQDAEPVVGTAGSYPVPTV